MFPTVELDKAIKRLEIILENKRNSAEDVANDEIMELSEIITMLRDCHVKFRVGVRTIGEVLSHL